MKREDYRPLGQYIQQTDIRNNELCDYPLLGVSVEKLLIPSVANTIGTDFSKYKILLPGEFVYIADTSRRGDKIAIALNKTEKSVLVSSAYTTFKVNNEYLLSDYLMLWVSRPEFDRYARFMSHGSVRELFSWEDMCNVMLPVPPIEEQRRIVAEYQTVERRIKNNEALIQKLEETAQAIYHHTFVEGIDENNLPEGWRKGCLGDLGDVIGGSTPSTENAAYWVEDGISWLAPADMPRNQMYISETVKHITEEAYKSTSTKLLPIGSVLFSSRAPIGLVAITDIELCTNQGYKSVVPKKEIGDLFVYYLLQKERTIIANQQEGSTFAEISGKELSAYEIIIPAVESIRDFTSKAQPIAKLRKNLEHENSHLRTLLSLLTSKLA